MDETIKDKRDFLKALLWAGFNSPEFDTDQRKGVEAPPMEKPIPAGARLVDLVAPSELKLGQMALLDVINQRRSRRAFTSESLNLVELSYLLWCTQGVQRVHKGGFSSLRTVPSGGARHEFETYLAIHRVEGLEPGVYRYLPLEHQLCFEFNEPDLAEKVATACCGQEFIQGAAVVFFWAAVPYRMEWRYGAMGHKVIAIDAGHICQNLYLAAESIGAGTCAVGAYEQDKVDAVLRLDGVDEFVVYVAPVGRVE